MRESALRIREPLFREFKNVVRRWWRSLSYLARVQLLRRIVRQLAAPPHASHEPANGSPQSSAKQEAADDQGASKLDQNRVQRQQWEIQIDQERSAYILLKPIARRKDPNPDAKHRRGMKDKIDAS